jgi:sigma-B regulation protein RsbU (phosphoserine phosphatase)
MTPSIRILLIDDDRVLQSVLERILRSQGAEVLVASSGRDGLVLARRHHPQLLICDWCMAEMDGLEVCRTFKEDPELAPIFFILLTSRGAIEDRVAGLDAGADDFLIKPVDSSELTARVRAGLRLHESNRKLRELSHDLAEQKRRLEEELSSAADYVRSILPAPLEGDVDIDCLFLPSSQLGGDCLDFYWLDAQHLVIYVLDVSGHGLAAALPSISVHNLLRTQARLHQLDPAARSPGEPDCLLQRPSEVLRYLNRLFQSTEQNSQYFTIWFGVFDSSHGDLRYASAGHPPALLRSTSLTGDPEWQELKAPGMPIGLFQDAVYEERLVSISAPSQLILYTDGMYEIPQADGSLWDHISFRALLQEQFDSGRTELAELVREIQSRSGVDLFPDDASAIRIRFHRSSGASEACQANDAAGDNTYSA